MRLQWKSLYIYMYAVSIRFNVSMIREAAREC